MHSQPLCTSSAYSEVGISYASTGSTLKIRFRYKGGNLETVWIAYWKGGYLAKIPREGGTWKSGIPKGGNLSFSLDKKPYTC